MRNSPPTAAQPRVLLELVDWIYRWISRSRAVAAARRVVCRRVDPGDVRLRPGDGVRKLRAGSAPSDRFRPDGFSPLRPNSIDRRDGRAAGLVRVAAARRAARPFAAGRATT